MIQIRIATITETIAIGIALIGIRDGRAVVVDIGDPVVIAIGQAAIRRCASLRGDPREDHAELLL